MKSRFEIKVFKNFKTWLSLGMIVFLFLYTFSLPSFSGRPIFQYISYGLMFVLIIITSIFVLLYKVHKRVTFHWILLTVPLFSIWALLGTLLFSHQYRSWLTLLLLAITFVVFYFSFLCLGNPKIIAKIIFLALFSFSIYFIIHYRYNFIHFKSLGQTRLGSFFDNENAIGGYMSLSITLGLYLVIFFEKKIELLYSIPLFLCFLVGISTGSRAFFIVSILSIFVFLFIKFQKKKWLFIILSAISVGLLIALLQLPFMETIRDRLWSMLTTFSGNDAEKSSVTRYLWQQYAFYLGLKNPLIGYGSFGFTYFSGVGTYCHGNLAEVFCNFGIVGTILFYSVPFYCAIKSLKWKSSIKAITVTLFLYYILTSFMTVNYFHKDTFMIYALLVYIVNESKIENKGVFK